MRVQIPCSLKIAHIVSGFIGNVELMRCLCNCVRANAIKIASGYMLITNYYLAAAARHCNCESAMEFMQFFTLNL